MRIFTGSTNCDDREKKGNSKGKIMVNLLENIRNPEEIVRLNEQRMQSGKLPKYNLEEAQRNIVYESCRTKEEAFMSVFGDAMEQYNATQKRNDRKTSLEKELEKLDKGKVKQELIHCMIVQIGDKEHHPPEEECVEMLQEYLEKFRERFPNMRIVNAAIHLDEDTPHLQIYHIPIKSKQQHEALGNPKKWSGMDIQPSLTGALEQMDYDNSATVSVPKKDAVGNPVLDENGEQVFVEKHDYKNGAMAQWQRDYNGLLDEICAEHDIAINHYMRGRKVKHQDTIDYYDGKIHKEIAKAMHDKDVLEADLSEAFLEIENAREEKQKLQADKKFLQAENADLRGEREALQGEIRELKSDANALQNSIEATEQRAEKTP